MLKKIGKTQNIKIKNFGFTLIELIGALIILAVIALIATPIVLNVIESTRMLAFKNSVYGILESARYINIENYPQIKEGEYICDGIICKSKEDKLNFTGEVPIGGSILVDKTTITAEYITNGVYCAYGTTSDLKVQKGCQLLDKTGPIIDETKMKLSSTSDKIIVNLEENFAVDDESGILKYVYSLYLNDELIEEKESKLTSTVFNKLKENTLYKVKVTVYNRATTTSEIEKEISTKPIINPVVNQIGQDPEHTEYATKRIIQITYSNDNIENAEYYFKSTVKANIESGIVIQSCGTNIEPSNCENSATDILTENTWYKTNKKIVILTYRTEGYLYSLSSDGTNMIGGSTYNIANIDTGIPTIKPIEPEKKFIVGEDRSIESLFEIKSNGPLPVTTTCKINDETVNNLKNLAINNYTIVCETVKSSEVKANASVVVKIVSNTCSADTVGEIIGGYICSAPNPNCFTCPSGKQKIQLANGNYTCK